MGRYLYSFQLICFIQVAVNHLSGFPIQNGVEAAMYLKKFGYVGRGPRLQNDAGSSDTASAGSEALRMFQHAMHINETGILDSNTLQVMNAKRCGNPDMNQVLLPSPTRQKRYQVNPEKRKWAQSEVTYGISKYPSDTTLNRHIINTLTTRAFEMWQDAADSKLRFKNITGIDSPELFQADIDIRFVTGYHNDNDPFDGPGETLAHAFPPGEGIYGDIHVDEEEDWDLEGKFNGSNYYWVIIHEIGHSLGLSHSMADTAIMMAVEPDYDPDLKLHQDDKKGLRHLYELSEPIEEKPTEKENENQAALEDDIHPRRNYAQRCRFRPDPCSQDFRINAATVLENGEIYLFSGCYAIHVNNEGKVIGNHRSQAKFRALLSDNLDAAITTPAGHTYFFEGSSVRRYFNFVQDPERGRGLFSDIPAPIDAGFYWKNQSKIYLIKGKRFFLLDSYRRNRNASGLISKWGVPDDTINAAFVRGDRVYLFSGDHFWVLEERNGEFQVDQPTPRSIRTEFLRC